MFKTYAKRLYTALALVLLVPSTASVAFAQAEDKVSVAEKQIIAVIQLEATKGWLLKEAAQRFLKEYQVQGSKAQKYLTEAISDALESAKAEDHKLTDKDYRIIADNLLFVRIVDSNKIRLNLSSSTNYTEQERNELVRVRKKVLAVIRAVAVAEIHQYYGHRAGELLEAYEKMDWWTKVVMDQLIMRAIRKAKKDKHILTDWDYETLAHCLLAAIVLAPQDGKMVNVYFPV